MAGVGNRDLKHVWQGVLRLPGRPEGREQTVVI